MHLVRPERRLLPSYRRGVGLPAEGEQIKQGADDGVDEAQDHDLGSWRSGPGGRQPPSSVSRSAAATADPRSPFLNGTAQRAQQRRAADAPSTPAQALARCFRQRGLIVSNHRSIDALFWLAQSCKRSTTTSAHVKTYLLPPGRTSRLTTARRRSEAIMSREVYVPSQ
jgi:hypothetical protein